MTKEESNVTDFQKCVDLYFKSQGVPGCKMNYRVGDATEEDERFKLIDEQLINLNFQPGQGFILVSESKMHEIQLVSDKFIGLFEGNGRFPEWLDNKGIAPWSYEPIHKYDPQDFINGYPSENKLDVVVNTIYDYGFDLVEYIRELNKYKISGPNKAVFIPKDEFRSIVYGSKIMRTIEGFRFVSAGDGSLDRVLKMIKAIPEDQYATATGAPI